MAIVVIVVLSLHQRLVGVDRRRGRLLPGASPSTVSSVNVHVGCGYQVAGTGRSSRGRLRLSLTSSAGKRVGGGTVFPVPLLAPPRVGGGCWATGRVPFFCPNLALLFGEMRFTIIGLILVPRNLSFLNCGSKYPLIEARENYAN